MRPRPHEIGQCIYCGDSGPDLTREHVMPRGLGGNRSVHGTSEAMILGRASCPRCQCITRNIEQRCLVDMMDPARVRLGFKRKDRRPEKYLAKITHSDGSESVRQVEDKHIPGFMVIPSFPFPGILAGDEWVETNGPEAKILSVKDPDEIDEPDIKSIGLTLSSNAWLFSRMLCKIALGATIYKFGMGAIESFVNKYILDGDMHPNKLVGGYMGENIPSQPTDSLHKIKFGNFDGNLLVFVHMFAGYGAPLNYVVVGRILKELDVPNLRDLAAAP